MTIGSWLALLLVAHAFGIAFGVFGLAYVQAKAKAEAKAREAAGYEPWEP